MKYVKVKIYTSKQGIEPLTSAIMECGFTDFEIHDGTEIEELLKRKNTFHWDYIDEKVITAKENETCITLYLEDTSQGRKHLGQIKKAVEELRDMEGEGEFGSGASLGRLYLEETVVDDETWRDNWREFVKPRRITNRIYVKPVWEEYAKKHGELIIDIGPGMAFGTGEHPTTSMCLKLIESCEGRFKSVLDIGCGSGILSMAAALLGGERVLGVDKDPVAVDVAKENIGLNGLEDKISVVIGDLTKEIDFKADLIIANLIANLIIDLAPDIKKNLIPGGFFISSGIFNEKLDEVLSALQRSNLEVLNVMKEDEWSAVLAVGGEDTI
jgi:ribosomal protein L11 methyltransferase